MNDKPGLGLEKIPETLEIKITPKIFSVPGSEKYPVAIYKLYGEKRPTETDENGQFTILPCCKQHTKAGLL